MKTLPVVAVLALSIGAATYGVGIRFAEDAENFNKALGAIAQNAAQQHAIPADYVPRKPSGVMAWLYERHPNNELVKGIYFATDPDDFALDHPNNDAVKLYSLLSTPKEFVRAHPNNDLAKGLQVLIDTKGFYTEHPNNDFGKALYAIYDPNGFRKAHPNNELGKAYQLLFAPGGFMHDHPNNEITRLVGFFRRGFR